MGEFLEIANRIAELLEELKKQGGLTVGQLPDRIDNAVGNAIGEYNLYPSTKTSDCKQLAIFLSLKSKSYAGKRRHIDCRKAMVKLVQHMQGYCKNRTHAALLLTDNWDPIAYDDWMSNLKQIKNDAHIEIYLLAEGQASELKI